MDEDGGEITCTIPGGATLIYNVEGNTLAAPPVHNNELTLCNTALAHGASLAELRHGLEEGSPLAIGLSGIIAALARRRAA